jgi:hypothetical protein
MTAKIIKFNSETWQFTEGTPSELFAFAAQKLLQSGGRQFDLAGMDILKSTLGAWYLTLYFGNSPTINKE